MNMNIRIYKNACDKVTLYTQSFLPLILFISLTNALLIVPTTDCSDITSINSLLQCIIVVLQKIFNLQICTAPLSAADWCRYNHRIHNGGKSYGYWKILHFKNQPCNRLYPKNWLECIAKAEMILYLG